MIEPYAENINDNIKMYKWGCGQILGPHPLYKHQIIKIFLSVLLLDKNL